MPKAETYLKEIEGDDLNLEMAVTSEEQQKLQEAKASKIWRTLRIASRHRLSRFDKIDDGKNLQALFEQENVEDAVKDEGSGGGTTTTEATDGRGAGPVPEQTGQQDRRADQTGPAMQETTVKFGESGRQRL